MLASSDSNGGDELGVWPYLVGFRIADDGFNKRRYVFAASCIR
jgi:hypothetical protein